MTQLNPIENEGIEKRETHTVKCTLEGKKIVQVENYYYLLLLLLISIPLC